MTQNSCSTEKGTCPKCCNCKELRGLSVYQTEGIIEEVHDIRPFDIPEHLEDMSDVLQEYILEDIGRSIKMKNNPHLLARVVGQHFVPGGNSRNKRNYEDVWERQVNLPRVLEALKDGMIGLLAHPKNEAEAHPKHGSHAIKKLWIDEDNRGMGEAYVLDTPIGRIVNTYLRSGVVNLYVSSRAYGEFLKGAKTAEGYPKLNPATFMLHTFDWVTSPGFLEANPKLVESIVEDLEEGYYVNTRKTTVMSPYWETLTQLQSELQSSSAQEILTKLLSAK